MKKIKFLSLILILLCCFTLTSCTDDENGNDTPKTIAVKDAVDNIKREKNYRIELQSYVIETNNEEVKSQSEYKVTMLTKEDARKIEITYSEIVITLYQIKEKGVEYIIFNPSLISTGAVNKWVKGTTEQIAELFGNVNNDSSTLKVSSSISILDLVTELFDFFKNIKNEYFTLNGVGNYEFNQAGKDALRAVVEDIITKLFGENQTPQDATIDSKCTIGVNKKYITNLLANIFVTPTNTPNNKVTIKNIATLDKFNEVVIKLPTETISFEEFKNTLNN